MPQAQFLRRGPKPSPSVLQVASQLPGKLFAIATHRLDHQKRVDQLLAQPFFTSNLRANEYLLTCESGCTPIGLVMGAFLRRD